MGMALGQCKGPGCSGILSVTGTKQMLREDYCVVILLQAIPQQFVAQGLLDPVVVEVSLIGSSGILFYIFAQPHVWSIIPSSSASTWSSLHHHYSLVLTRFANKLFLMFHFPQSFCRGHVFCLLFVFLRNLSSFGCIMTKV